MKKLAHLLIAVPLAAMLMWTLYTGNMQAAEQSPATEPQQCLIEDTVEEVDTEPTMCGRCGDGFCVPSCGEDMYSCPQDCSAVSS